LGSSRLATTTTRTKYYDVAYAPYGEDYNGSGATPDLASTDQNQDTVSGGWTSNLYDFMFREYRTAHGRWASPDPAAMSAVDPTNPQTWDRYAYVLNNPTAMVDLLGEDGCYDGNGQVVNVVQALCDSMNNGWAWIQTTFTVINGAGQATTLNFGVTQTGSGLAYTSPNGAVLSPWVLGEVGVTPLPGNGAPLDGVFPNLSPGPAPGCPPGANCSGMNVNVGMCGYGDFMVVCELQRESNIVAPKLDKLYKYTNCVAKVTGLGAATGLVRGLAVALFTEGASIPASILKSAGQAASAGAVACAAL
jgi:RHS repeat-associated protein